MGLFGPNAEERENQRHLGQLQIRRDRHTGDFYVWRYECYSSGHSLSYCWSRLFSPHKTEPAARAWIKAEMAGDEIVATFEPCQACGR